MYTKYVIQLLISRGSTQNVAKVGPSPSHSSMRDNGVLIRPLFYSYYITVPGYTPKPCWDPLYDLGYVPLIPNPQTLNPKPPLEPKP